jgi:hypothetical protein
MSDNPEMRPGEDVGAAVGRIRLWLEQHPNNVNVASEIGSSEKYRSPGWPYRLYAVDRRDLLAVLDAADGPDPFEGFQIYASRAAMVCERCDTNVTYGDEDPRLSSLVEAAAAHTCTPEDLAKVRDFRTG